jgi:hypothetical protein
MGPGNFLGSTRASTPWKRKETITMDRCACGDTACSSCGTAQGTYPEAEAVQESYDTIVGELLNSPLFDDLEALGKLKDLFDERFKACRDEQLTKLQKRVEAAEAARAASESDS